MRRRIQEILLLFLLMLLGLWGCGKKAPPLAPESRVPAPVSDLRVWAKEGGVFLGWSLPTRNIDRSRIEDLLGFKVFRLARPLNSSPCPECPAKFESVAEIDVEYPREAQVERGRVLWRDRAVFPQHEYIYFVLAYNSSRLSSTESNRERILWGEPPAAPEKVKVKSEDRALELTWVPSLRLLDGSNMVDLVGFNIYRRTEKERFGFYSLNRDPIPEHQYLDAGLENGQLYYYEVRAVRNFRGTLVEGPGSAPVVGRPEKHTPPSIPTGLVAVTQKAGVELRWDWNPEPDIAGYDLYRKEKGEADFTKINSRLITENYYLDELADPQKYYLYRLKAVDTSPFRNESEFSQEVEISPEKSNSKQ